MTKSVTRIIVQLHVSVWQACGNLTLCFCTLRYRRQTVGMGPRMESTWVRSEKLSIVDIDGHDEILRS